MSNDEPQRETLVESLERDEEKLGEAIGELQSAVHRTFGLSDKISHQPWPWLFGGLLLGLWLAVRRNGSE